MDKPNGESEKGNFGIPRPRKKIKVLVVDDSALMRRIITRILQEDPDIEVIGTAKDGEEAVEKTLALDPDVITLDVHMPRMDGLTALKIIMEKKPKPVVMISSLTREGAEATFEALRLGAVDYITKPSGTVSLDLVDLADEIRAKVKAAASSKVIPGKVLLPIELKAKQGELTDIVVAFGASTGGPKTVVDILSDFKVAPPSAFVVAIHMPPQFTKSFAERLSKYTPINFKEAEDGDELREYMGYVAPGGRNMKVVREGKKLRVRITDEPDTLFKPSCDVLFYSLAESACPRCIAVLLTGIGYDGAKGLLAIKEKGGITIAESEESAIVFGMPRTAIELGAAKYVLPSWRIARTIKTLIKKLKEEEEFSGTVV